jgi:hypothetical protein
VPGRIRQSIPGRAGRARCLEAAADQKRAYTENGQELKLGDGMWGPTVTLGNCKLYFADPQAGQVGFFGTIEEHGHPVILGLRLKIENNKKIGEMEAIALRKTSGVFSEPQNLVDKPIFHQALTPSERRARAELIRVANSYFEGMEAGTDKNTPFDQNCQCIENGVITSNDPASQSEITRMSCGAQFATGFTKVITRVQERRFPVVDEERGMVLSIIRFDHSGKNKTITWADGTEHKVNPPFDQPYSFFIAELFKIVDGKINLSAIRGGKSVRPSPDPVPRPQASRLWPERDRVRQPDRRPPAESIHPE